MPDKYRLVRVLRTLSSEIYLVWEGERRLGQLDVHYADGSIHASLILEAELTEADEKALYEQIDDDIVSSYLPSFDREEFVLTVFRGEEVDSFNWPPPEAGEEN